MGTARHRHHHNTFPTTYRTQSITSTKDVYAAPDAASQLFCKQRIAFVFGRLGHSPRLIIIYQCALSSRFFSIAVFIFLKAMAYHLLVADSSHRCLIKAKDIILQ